MDVRGGSRGDYVFGVCDHRSCDPRRFRSEALGSLWGPWREVLTSVIVFAHVVTVRNVDAAALQ
jgi:hypothetical protein